MQLNLTGWVRNLHDGRVELVAEGSDPSLQELFEWCKVGPPEASVNSLDADFEDSSGEFSSFGIR